MPHHQRIVLHLHDGAASRTVMREAAELAHLLGLDMFGVFVEDEAVHGLAAMPFVRELRLPSHEWQAIDPGRVAAEFRHAAMTAKRLLDDTARGMGVTCGFEVRRGDPSGVIADLLRSNDILVLAVPGASTEALTQSFPRTWQTATRSDASVLLVPRGVLRRRGPVVMLLGAAGLRGVRTASHIASIARETLVVLGSAAPRDAAAGAARSMGVEATRVQTCDLAEITEAALRFALADRAERLLVLDREGLLPEQEAAVLRVAAARGTPVLLVGPETEERPGA